MDRHFTATGYVVIDNSILLHFHPKVKMWLPPGGHIELNEDPNQAVIREVYEETSIEVELISDFENFNFDYPKSLIPPEHILKEDIDDPVDGFHQHIDLIYYCKPINPLEDLPKEWVAISRDQLINKPHTPIVISTDVRKIGVSAIEKITKL